jgi:subtilisin family serine protease
LVFTSQFSFGQTLLFANHSNEILIQLDDQIFIISFLKEVNAKHGFDLKLKKEIASSWGIFLLEKRNTKAANDLILEILKEENQIIHANENRPAQVRDTEPNDPFYAEQWHYERIGLPQVWDYTTGGQTTNGDEIVVAIVDSGFKTDHPDFAGQIQETIDFASQPNTKHGTAVTGFIGARGNNGGHHGRQLGY